MSTIIKYIILFDKITINKIIKIQRLYKKNKKRMILYKKSVIIQSLVRRYLYKTRHIRYINNPDINIVITPISSNF